MLPLTVEEDVTEYEKNVDQEGPRDAVSREEIFDEGGRVDDTEVDDANADDADIDDADADVEDGEDEDGVHDHCCRSRQRLNTDVSFVPSQRSGFSKAIIGLGRDATRSTFIG